MNIRVNINQLKVGDTIEVWWRPGRDTITTIEPYKGPLLATLGIGTKIARFALNPVGMTLEAGAIFNRIKS